MSALIAIFDVAGDQHEEEAALRLEGVLRNRLRAIRPEGIKAEIWEVRPGELWLEDEPRPTGFFIEAFIEFEDVSTPEGQVAEWLLPILRMNQSGIHLVQRIGPANFKRPWQK